MAFFVSLEVIGEPPTRTFFAITLSFAKNNKGGNSIYLSKANELPEFSYARLPMFLFDERYKDVSAEAKLLYALLFRRLELSKKNHWTNDNGCYFVYFTIEEVKECIGCCNQKAVRLMQELERANLINKRRQGLGKPNQILFSVLPKDRISNGTHQKCEKQPIDF